MTPGIVTIRFTTHWPWNPVSPVIAWASGSKIWSHTVALIDDLAYESTMMHGCRVVPVAEAMSGVARYQDMPVLVPDIEAAKAFGRAQNGAGYDFAGALGIPFLMSEDWADESKWWCSEHNCMLLYRGGVQLFDLNERSRVTPNDIHATPHPKSPIVYLS